MNYFDTFKKLRKLNHLTQKDVADLLGLESTQFVSLFERGISKIPRHTVGQLCFYFDVNTDIFVNAMVAEYRNKVIEEVTLGYLDAKKKSKKKIKRENV